MKLLSIFLFFIVVSCSQAPSRLSDEDVELLYKKPSRQCTVMGTVTGENEYGSELVAQNDLRNQAGEMGANAVYIKDTVVNGKRYVIHGIAYKCK